MKKGSKGALGGILWGWHLEILLKPLFVYLLFFVVLPGRRERALVGSRRLRPGTRQGRAQRAPAPQQSSDLQPGPEIHSLRPPTPRRADSSGFDGWLRFLFRPPAPRKADLQGSDVALCKNGIQLTSYVTKTLLEINTFLFKIIPFIFYA